MAKQLTAEQAMSVIRRRHYTLVEQVSHARGTRFNCLTPDRKAITLAVKKPVEVSA